MTFLLRYIITSTLLLLKHFMVIHYYTIKQNWNHYRWYREPSTPWWTGNRQRAYRLVATTRSRCQYNRKGKFLNQSIPMILLKRLSIHWVFVLDCWRGLYTFWYSQWYHKGNYSHEKKPFYYWNYLEALTILGGTFGKIFLSDKSCFLLLECVQSYFIYQIYQAFL